MRGSAGREAQRGDQHAQPGDGHRTCALIPVGALMYERDDKTSAAPPEITQESSVDARLPSLIARATSSALYCGWYVRKIAARPLTYGVAIEVPLKVA